MRTRIFGMLLMVSAFLLTSCASEKELAHVPMISRESFTVGTGQISSNNSYLGYVEGIEQSSVGAKIGGRVMTLNVREGDRVKKGDILALLDGIESKEGLQSAQDIFGSTESVYQNTANLFDAQIQQAIQKLHQVEQAMDIAHEAAKGNVTGLSDTKLSLQEQLSVASKQVEQAQIAVDTSKNQYANIKTTLEQKEQDVYTNAINGISTADILMGNILTYTDRIFGVSDENRSLNDAYEMFLGAKNSASKQQVEKLWRESDIAYSSWKVASASLISGYQGTAEEKARIDTQLKSTQVLLEKFRMLTSGASDCFDETIASSTLSQATIDGFKSQISTFRNNIEQTLISASGNYIIGIKGSIQSIDNLKNERKTQLTYLQKQIDLAEKSLEVVRQNYSQYDAAAAGKVNATETQTTIAEKQYELTKCQYDEAVAGINSLKKQKDTQLSLIQAQLAQIRGSRDMASISVSNNTIVAPFDGVVVAKSASIGQVVGAGLPLFTIAKDDMIKIKIFVGQSVVGNIKVGDATNILFDSSGTGVLSGTIHTIQPVADTISKKIPVEIWIKNADRKILLGMYVNVALKGDISSGIKVPYRFIEYAYGEPNLNISLPGGKIEKRRIKTQACSEIDCIVEGNIHQGDIVLLP